MPPNQGLVHLKEYDVKDSNVELIGSDIDHKVKHASATTEPAWNDGRVGIEPGLIVWRIEDFEVVPWPREKTGQFYDGDSYIVLNSREVGDDSSANKHLVHDVYFWLGAHTSQDEAGTAAYKTVELDEFLKGTATQYREVQAAPSDGFVRLFPRMEIRSGGVRSGFRHVELDEDGGEKSAAPTLLRVFRTGTGASTVVVVEVEPTVASLDDEDVFVLDVGDKIWVWQGRGASPMEKAKAAQVVHDMTLAKHVESEVVSQLDSRSGAIVSLLGGSTEELDPTMRFQAERPVTSASSSSSSPSRPKRLFRLSDASGSLDFALVKDGAVQRDDLRSEDVFVLDSGNDVWVWEGSGASRAERKMWLRAAQDYVKSLGQADPNAWRTPIGKVVEGSESPAFFGVLGG